MCCILLSDYYFDSGSIFKYFWVEVLTSTNTNHGEAQQFFKNAIVLDLIVIFSYNELSAHVFQA